MRFIIRITCISLFLLVTACSPVRVLAPTPKIFSEGNYPHSEIATSLQNMNPSIYYVTDRKPAKVGGELNYTAVRSSSMVFGASQVSFGTNENWHTLSAASGDEERRKKLPLSVLGNREIIHFQPTPIPFRVVGGVPRRDPADQASYRQTRAKFQNYVRAQMSIAGKKEVVIFVHGFNNTFEDAIFSLADIWHFSGRTSVPIAYSWPAGAGGAFGYFTDRESGEFTIFHLKEFLLQLSSIPELRKIHIVAHSRGTDVTTTALRELVIAVRNQGKSPRRVLKVENLILAAPDLDFSVVRQRLIAEQFGTAIGQITVYMNKSDTALGLAQRLMTGQRLGRLTVDDLQTPEREIFSRVKTVNFVNIEGVKGFTGHAYFRKNPSVLSDIALLIRNSAAPGTVERPLTKTGVNFWSMPEGYPS